MNSSIFKSSIFFIIGNSIIFLKYSKSLSAFQKIKRKSSRELKYYTFLKIGQKNVIIFKASSG